MITSSVKQHGGVPTLFVNGEPTVGAACITYLPECARYSDFSQADYRLFSFSCFFGTQSINESSGIYPFADGIFENKDKPDYSLFDCEMKNILSDCPDTLVFPRVNVSLPKWWEAENPDECNYTGVGKRPPRACFSSRKWLDEVNVVSD